MKDHSDLQICVTCRDLRWLSGCSPDEAASRSDGPHLMRPDSAAWFANGENRLAKATGSGSTVYEFDGLGQRVTKQEAGGTLTYYVYDAFGGLAAEYLPTGPSSPAGTHYLSTDHLGSTRLVTNANGDVVSRHDYLPFGEEIPNTVGNRQSVAGYAWNGSLTQRFTGKERDGETGLDYFGARYLSGAMGRFTSPDPVFFKLNRVVSPQRWNLYSYALGNPLKIIDPDGRDAMGVVFTRFRAGHEVLGVKMRVPTGHGATIVVDSTGRTRYFEYGRYESNLGQTHRRPVPDLKLDKNGQPTTASLEAMFDKISQAYGQDSPIEAILIPTDDAEDLALQQYLESRVRQNSDSKRPAYTIWGHNCGTLICDALAKTNQRTMNDPYGTPQQVLDRLRWLHVLNSTTYSYDPGKKKGQRVEVRSTIRFDEPEHQQ